MRSLQQIHGFPELPTNCFPSWLTLVENKKGRSGMPASYSNGKLGNKFPVERTFKHRLCKDHSVRIRREHIGSDLISMYLCTDVKRFQVRPSLKPSLWHRQPERWVIRVGWKRPQGRCWSQAHHLWSVTLYGVSRQYHNPKKIEHCMTKCLPSLPILNWLPHTWL